MRNWLLAIAACGLLACSDEKTSGPEEDAGNPPEIGDAGDDIDTGAPPAPAVDAGIDAGPDTAVPLNPFDQLRPPVLVPRPPRDGLPPELWPPVEG